MYDQLAGGPELIIIFRLFEYQSRKRHTLLLRLEWTRAFTKNQGPITTATAGLCS